MRCDANTTIFMPTIDKKRKVDVPSESRQRASRIFSPFRVVGCVSNDTPFSLGTLGSTFYIVTSVGRSFQIYDAATLHLLFVSQTQTSSKITCLATHFHYVFAAYGSRIGIFKRGRLEHTIECPSDVSISHLLCFGEYLVATSTCGKVFVYKRQLEKYATELHTTLTAINSDFEGDIVGLVHPPTYLNKIVVATTNHLFLFNIRTGKLLYKTSSEQIQGPISSIETAPALDIMAVGTSTGNVHLFHLKKAKTIGPLIKAGDSKVAAISFRTDRSHHIVAGLTNGDLYFYDLEKQSRVHTLHGAHKQVYGGVSNVKFLNGQPIVVTNGADNQLKEYVFDPSLSTSSSSIVSPPRHLRSRGGHSAPPIAIEFPQENKSHFLLSASRDRSFWSFSLRKDAQAQELSQRLPKGENGKRIAGPVSSMKEKFPEIVCISSSQAREGEWENVITGHKDETFARTWNSRSKRVGRHSLETIDNGIVKSVCISQCGNFGLVGSSQGGIGVYNLQSGLLRKRYVLHRNAAVTGLAIDGMNRNMVSCGLDGIVGFYDFTNLKYLGKLQLDAPITFMAYHKSSDLVACALDDLSIVIIDTVTQKVIRVLYGHTNRITSLDFSPNGRWIVLAALDATMRTWDLPTGGCIDGIRLPSVVTAVKFSPIGDYIATAHVSGNGVSLWTNKAQFKTVSARHLTEDEFATTLLPNASGHGGSTLLDGAFEDDEETEIAMDSYKSKDQIENMTTLYLGSRGKYSTVLHLDNIKQRNKPKETAQKPKQAPFFLSLSAGQVGDQARENELGSEEQAPKEGDEDEADSRLLKLKENGKHNFESRFTQLLRAGSKQKDYREFLEYLVECSPATIDLEVRSLNSFAPLEEMTSFMEAMIQGLESKTNFDMIESIVSIFLRIHGDVIVNHPMEKTLQDTVQRWNEKNQQMAVTLDSQVKYCAGVISFLSTV